MTDKVRVITEEQCKEYMELKNQTSKKVKHWEPKEGDRVWVVYASGDLEETTFLSALDRDMLKMGFCFKTKKEAQKERDRRLAEQELLDMCDWKSGEWVCIRYDVGKKLFNFTSFGFLVYSPYRFASLTSCKRAIDTLGTEKLKLIFRMD